MTATDLHTHSIPGVLRFEDAPSGLTRAVISTPLADATVYLHGAHITAWTPAGQHPVLFTSSRSKFEPGAPIRGGVPLVFPWFGPRGDGQPGPLHGFARISEWTVESARVRPDGIVDLVLSLPASHLRFRISIGAALEMELEVRNPSDAPFRFEEAFHTYFAIGDIRQVSIAGLEGTTYIDKTDAFARKQCAGPLHISRETDQVHLDTTSTCQIHDPALHRTITIEKRGSNTTVVWNPWIEKSRTLPDLSPDDWQTMLCLETANALDNAIVLPPGATHTMSARISVL